MKSILLIISLAVIVYSCNNGNKGKPLQQSNNFDYTIPRDKGVLYYPLDSLSFVLNGKNRGSDSLIKSIYSEILFNLKEPVLYNYKGRSETIRLLWVRAFDNPIMIRANNLEDSIYINIKELGKEFYGSDSFVYRKKVDTTFMLASTNKWNDIFNKSGMEKVVSLHSYDTLNDGGYKDATMWVLEYNLQGKYHCIDRLYLDTLSLAQYPITKEMYNIGNIVLSMKSRWEQ